MKKVLFAIWISVISISFISCERKKHFSEVTYSDGVFYYDQKPYTGMLWSKDNVTASGEFYNGEILRITLYHSKGKKAMTWDVAKLSKRSYNIIFKDDYDYFDEDGNKIDCDEFEKRYPDFRDKNSQVVSRELGFR
jgi:hypothetical protein